MASTQTPGQGNQPMYPITGATKDDFIPVEEFISNFYRASDITGDVEQWVKLFTKGAVVRIGDGPATPDQIALKDLRMSMWNDVKTRRHTVTRVFPARFPDRPEDDLGFAAFGSVKIESKKTVDDPGSVFRERDWSAYGQLKKEDGVYKLAHYQVYFGGQRSTST